MFAVVAQVSEVNMRYLTKPMCFTVDQRGKVTCVRKRGEGRKCKKKKE